MPRASCAGKLATVMPLPTDPTGALLPGRRSLRAVAAVRAIGELGLNAELLVPALLELLHDIVPSSRNLFDWTDERGRLLHYFIEGPVDEVIARHYFDEFHNRRETEVMPPFEALQRAPGGIRSAAELDHPAFFESALYQEIWRPQGLRYRVEAVLRGSRGQLLGSLVLYRGPGEKCFSLRDELQLAALLPLLAQALERATPPPAGTRFVRHHDGRQSLLLGNDGIVRHATPGARRLLMLARGGITRERLELPLELLAGDVASLLLHALKQPQREGSTPPTFSHQNAWGRFMFQGHRLRSLGSQPAMFQIDLGWSVPHAVALERALRRLPLTPGQLAVCRQLYRGQAQAEIARQLRVAPSTVIDHVRKLYRTLELRSAADLRALLDAHIDEGRA